MAQYSRKPIVVDALQWTGSNNIEMNDFLVAVTPNINVRWSFSHDSDHMEFVIGVQTLDGIQTSGDLPVADGDWVVCNENYVLVRLLSAEFDASYEAVP